MTYFDNPNINDWHQQIITGTVLGGSSLVKPAKGKNCYLFMRSSDQQWLKYKAAELNNLASQRPFTYEQSTARWHSNCFPIFTQLYNRFYPDKKKIVTMEILDSLRDIGLAIWYGDCGKLKGNTALLNTNKFGEKGTKLMSNYFSEAGIGKADVVREKNYFRLNLDEQASNKFFLIVANHLPEFMQKQLLPK